MNRWKFLLFGGDPSSPAMRRVVWRLGASSFAAGFIFGFFDVFETRPQPPLAYWLGGGMALYFGVVVNEFAHYYRQADEMLRRILVASLAIAGAVVTGGAFFWGMLEVLFDAPTPSMLAVGFFALIASSLAWIVAAWKST